MSRRQWPDGPMVAASGAVVMVGDQVQFDERGRLRTGRVVGECPDAYVWVMVPNGRGGEQRRIPLARVLANLDQPTLFDVQG